jgi:hypothetical protein
MVVAVADECVNSLGFSVMAADQPELSDVQVCGSLLGPIGLETKAEKIFVEFRTEYDMVKSLR